MCQNLMLKLMHWRKLRCMELYSFNVTMMHALLLFEKVSLASNDDHFQLTNCDREALQFVIDVTEETRNQVEKLLRNQEKVYSN